MRSCPQLSKDPEASAVSALRCFPGSKALCGAGCLRKQYAFSKVKGTHGLSCCSGLALYLPESAFLHLDPRVTGSCPLQVKLALCQLLTTDNKEANISTAQSAIKVIRQYTAFPYPTWPLALNHCWATHMRVSRAQRFWSGQLSTALDTSTDHCNKDWYRILDNLVSPTESASARSLQGAASIAKKHACRIGT